MACLREEVLYCDACGKTKELPKCCGRVMDFDTDSFFCTTCGREITNTIKCCKKVMSVRYKVRNIKKEIFGT